MSISSGELDGLNDCIVVPVDLGEGNWEKRSARGSLVIDTIRTSFRLLVVFPALLSL